ncbi:MAG: hypothetical protein JW837_15860 [Sedimentisphaerales bacterium]|nr:hypothetical protein [Sedimentisphaerales bacterium]
MKPLLFKSLLFCGKEMLDEDINLLVRLWGWCVGFAVCHGNSISLFEKLVDLNRVIQRFPSFGAVFGATL